MLFIKSKVLNYYFFSLFFDYVLKKKVPFECKIYQKHSGLIDPSINFSLVLALFLNLKVNHLRRKKKPYQNRGQK